MRVLPDDACEQELKYVNTAVVLASLHYMRAPLYANGTMTTYALMFDPAVLRLSVLGWQAL